jgi:hypothetical protein
MVRPVRRNPYWFMNRSELRVRQSDCSRNNPLAPIHYLQLDRLQGLGLRRNQQLPAKRALRRPPP